MIIKRCGTRDAKNVCELMEFGINWIGFDFRLNSPNFVRQISSRAGIIPDYGSRAAALGKETEKNGFMNESSLQRFGVFADDMPGIKIMKTLLIGSVDDLKLAQEYEGIVDYFLFKLGEIDAGLAAIKTYKGNTHFIIGNVEQEYLDQIKNFKHPMLLGVDIDNCTDVKVAVQTLAN